MKLFMLNPSTVLDESVSIGGRSRALRLVSKPYGVAARAKRRAKETAKRAGGTAGMRNVFAFILLSVVLLAGAVQAGSESALPPLDLNRATAEQLQALPGIGEVKAAAILAVRDAQGGFSSIEELEAVRGIGPSLATKLRPLVKVGSKARKSSGTVKK